jgi:hypothetical protein
MGICLDTGELKGQLHQMKRPKGTRTTQFPSERLLILDLLIARAPFEISYQLVKTLPDITKN